MKSIACVVLTILVLSAGAAVGQTSTSAYIDGNETVKLSVKSPKFNVLVTVIPRRVNTKDLPGGAGAPGQFPETVVTIRNLRITVNGSPIFVPRSAYVDLIWVRQAEVSLDGRMPTLTVIGGDASESYVARIEFDKMAVKRRAVLDPEIPNKPFQETIYYLRVVEDR